MLRLSHDRSHDWHESWGYAAYSRWLLRCPGSVPYPLGPATTTLHAPTALRDRAPNGARPLQVTGGRLRVDGCLLQPRVSRHMRDRRQIFARIYDLRGGGACSLCGCLILDFAARICAR